MFDRPLMLLLLLALPLVVAPALFAIRAGERMAGAISAALRFTVFVALVMMLAGLSIPVQSAARHMALVVAVDQSRSIAPDQRAAMMAEINQLRRAMDLRDRIAVVGFGRDARLIAPLTHPRLVAPSADPVDSGATDIAGALTTAEGIFPPDFERRLLLLTDGNETQGHALDEIPTLVDQHIRLFTTAPPP